MSKVTRLFDEICAKYPKRTAFIFFHDGKIQQHTFHDLENDVLIATETLTRYGVRPGDRILAFAKSSYQLCVYMLATFKLGASILYVDIWAQQEGLKRAFDNFQPTFILISNSTKLVRLLFPEINKINQIINVDNHVDDPNILQIYPEPKDAPRNAKSKRSWPTRNCLNYLVYLHFCQYRKRIYDRTTNTKPS